MIIVFFILLLLTGTNELSSVSAAAVAEIDSLVDCLDQSHLTPCRHFLGTLPPVQGPGIRSWEVFLYEETEYDLIEEDMFMWQRIFRMECSYRHSDFNITTSYFFDLDEDIVLCISSWWLENEGIQVFVDRFYYSGNEILAYSYNGAPLATPTEKDIEKGIARLEYARFIMDYIAAASPGCPPVFMEQFGYVYDNF